MRTGNLDRIDLGRHQCAATSTSEAIADSIKEARSQRVKTP